MSSTVSPLPGLEDEMRRLIGEAQKQDIFLRLVGGMAFKVHCKSTNHPSLKREYPDIDFVTDKDGARKLLDFLPAMGYTPNKTFNTLSGDRRQLYYDEVNGRQIDVFIEVFEMNHKLPIAARLHVEELTIPIAELFLTKAQIVKLNMKDVLDMVALLLDCEVGEGDHKSINTTLISGLCAQDWGLYTTVSNTLRTINDMIAPGKIELSEEETRAVREKTAKIQEAMDEAPKTLGWKMRAKIGTRVRWYDEVEEVQR